MISTLCLSMWATCFLCAWTYDALADARLELDYRDNFEQVEELTRPYGLKKGEQ